MFEKVVRYQNNNYTKNKEVNKDKNTPLWRYVTVKEVAGPKARGNKKWTCNFCQYDGNGSYSRVKAHLLHVSGIGAKKCSKVDDILRKELQNEEDEAKLAKEKAKQGPLNIPLPPVSESLKRKFEEGPIGKLFQGDVRETLHKKCAQFDHLSIGMWQWRMKIILEPGKDCLTLDDEDEMLLSFDGGDGMRNEAPNSTSTDASSSGKGKEVEELDDSDEE
ncbi:hypothetical protein IFM89_014524 [Coptis chinensis]|uniref:BED-type domain-containing protein n=1 Tax=Coptis chinensis TaxID=261450 RepID=A0A835HAV3_9MAGN|nr:hypothetical protein IFM89_014524 [Coptis chinensis]